MLFSLISPCLVSSLPHSYLLPSSCFPKVCWSTWSSSLALQRTVSFHPGCFEADAEYYHEAACVEKVLNAEYYHGTACMENCWSMHGRSPLVHILLPSARVLIIIDFYMEQLLNSAHLLCHISSCAPLQLAAPFNCSSINISSSFCPFPECTLLCGEAL